MVEVSKKLIKETTTTAVYNRLSELIASGYFQMGEWIRERHIREILGVSSTPIREALRMLVQERLLESVPHHGVRIRRLSIKEIQDFYELRAELEGLSAQLAAMWASEVQLLAVQDMLDEAGERMKKTSVHEMEAVRHNHDFHGMIAQASGNHALADSLVQQRSNFNLLRVMLWGKDKQRLLVTVSQHQAILDAIVDRNPGLARKRAQEHILDSATLMLKVARELENKS
ncbi:GntR family transcriptional regulator [Aneurinibacillus migulanus]|uniref:GntR family transcriptional regulator n=1 Tax=Aneurinibacillus migulanus TaxID=47500 RepID=UPI0020A01630|nr:GntR family transcriptional regulator [Aneurinibacillus migulanus]MCP1356313.1 GntR family transcriptional regulator [Aneurinibacillus migulanus]